MPHPFGKLFLCFARTTRSCRAHTCCTRRGRAWPLQPSALSRSGPSASPARPWPSGLSAPFGYASHRPPAPAGPRLKEGQTPGTADAFGVRLPCGKVSHPPGPPTSARMENLRSFGSPLPATRNPSLSLDRPATSHAIALRTTAGPRLRSIFDGRRFVRNTAVHTEPSATCSPPRLALHSAAG